MTVIGCATCTRHISISVLPGGNTVALADPERWAIHFGHCVDCGRHFCDRCVDKSKKCPLCGGRAEMHRPGDKYSIQEVLGGIKR